MTRYEQAVEGLDIARKSGLVRVRDGHTTWVCLRSAYEQAQMDLSEQDEDPEDEAGGEAYSALCSAITGPTIVGDGCELGTREERQALARRAVQEGLLDADEYLAQRYVAA
ncbi:MAG: hypothetical protein ABIL09_13405 [Gemmatimonadota bacterium]